MRKLSLKTLHNSPSHLVGHLRCNNTMLDYCRPLSLSVCLYVSLPLWGLSNYSHGIVCLLGLVPAAAGELHVCFRTVSADQLCCYNFLNCDLFLSSFQAAVWLFPSRSGMKIKELCYETDLGVELQVTEHSGHSSLNQKRWPHAAGERQSCICNAQETGSTEALIRRWIGCLANVYTDRQSTTGTVHAQSSECGLFRGSVSGGIFTTFCISTILDTPSPVCCQTSDRSQSHVTKY